MCEGQSPLVIVSVTSVGSYCVALGCQNKAILLDFTGLPRTNPGEKDEWQQSRGKAGCQNKAILLDFTGLPRMNPGEKDGWQQSRGKAGKPLNTAGYVELILYG